MRFRTLEDLRNQKVATLAGTLAHEILLQAERRYGLTAAPTKTICIPSATSFSVESMRCCSTTSSPNGDGG